MADPVQAALHVLGRLTHAPGDLWRATGTLASRGPQQEPLLAAAWLVTLVLAAAMFRQGLGYRSHLALGWAAPLLALAALTSGDAPATWAAALGLLPALHLSTRRCPSCGEGWLDLTVYADEAGTKRLRLCRGCGFQDSALVAPAAGAGAGAGAPPTPGVPPAAASVRGADEVDGGGAHQ